MDNKLQAISESLHDLEKYQKVNECGSIQELQAIILEFADQDGEREGMIKGRTRYFNAKVMADNAMNYYKDLVEPNALTREFGIR